MLCFKRLSHVCPSVSLACNYNFIVHGFLTIPYLTLTINFLEGNNTICQQKRQEELNKAVIIGGRSVVAPGTYLPTCKENGDFEIMQCHGSTGYCWCVDEKGNQIYSISHRDKGLQCERSMYFIAFFSV